jgi:osmotically-inducible protein OsmY
MDAAEVTKRLRATLEQEPRVNLHRDRVQVEFSDGIATISGDVADLAAKRLTLEAAAALPAVSGIIDRLHVRPAVAMGDGAIADHLTEALLGDSAFDPCGIFRRSGEARAAVRPMTADGNGWWIELSVADGGVVNLDGDVPSLSHKRLAGVLAWWVPGSRDVFNGLGVEPDEQDNDGEILDALRLVLDKDSLIDASQVRARCNAAVITLDGLVASDAQRDAAEFDAWALFGVDKVVNRIIVRPG